MCKAEQNFIFGSSMIYISFKVEIKKRYTISTVNWSFPKLGSRDYRGCSSGIKIIMVICQKKKKKCIENRLALKEKKKQRILR